MATQLNMLPATENPWVVYEYLGKEIRLEGVAGLVEGASQATVPNK